MMSTMEMWPLYKAFRNTELLIDPKSTEHAKQPVGILVTTGAMNPAHLGHRTMLEKAAACMFTQHNIPIVGAFLSPSHDDYLAGKFGAKKARSSKIRKEGPADSLAEVITPYIASEVRLQLCRDTVDDSPLIEVGSWECKGDHVAWPDFGVVAQHLAAHVTKEFAARYKGCVVPRVFYVCGEDHYSRCGLARRGIGHGVGLCVVTRSGRKAVSEPSLQIFAVEAEDETSDLSSTTVRGRLASSKTAEDVRRACGNLMHPTAVESLITVADFSSA